MPLSITHGMYETPIGSAQAVSGDEAVFVVIPTLSESSQKSTDSLLLSIDVTFKGHDSTRAQESLISHLIKSVLSDYLLRECDPYRTLTINICANTVNLALIANTVLVACIDGGLPLKRMFSCVGTDQLYVVDMMGITPYYQTAECTEHEVKMINEDACYIQESIEYSIRDMLNF